MLELSVMSNYYIRMIIQLIHPGCRSLQSFGSYKNGDENTFDALECLQFKKSRKKRYHCGASFELCFITLPVTEKCNRWISISLEGLPMDHLRQVVRTTFPPSHCLWKAIEAITTYLNVFQNDLSERMKCYPIVGGYPAFVGAITGRMNREELNENILKLCYIMEHYAGKDVKNIREAFP